MTTALRACVLKPRRDKQARCMMAFREHGNKKWKYAALYKGRKTPVSFAKIFIQRWRWIRHDCVAVNGGTKRAFVASRIAGCRFEIWGKRGKLLACFAWKSICTNDSRSPLGARRGTCCIFKYCILYGAKRSRNILLRGYVDTWNWCQPKSYKLFKQFASEFNLFNLRISFGARTREKKMRRAIPCLRTEHSKTKTGIFLARAPTRAERSRGMLFRWYAATLAPRFVFCVGFCSSGRARVDPCISLVAG